MAKPDMRVGLHGWLVLDKPLGLTSTQALGKARRLVGGKKAGHGGTLDPLATGILPLAFGEATKLVPHVMDGDKEYTFTVRWGERRLTDDAEGEVTERSDCRPSAREIVTALPLFTGKILQKPPAFSAIKVDGERAYDLARAGEIVDLMARHVVIHAFKLHDSSENEATFHVKSGKGMYVRSLARDLAIHLGTQGYVTALRRTRVGAFTLDDAVTLQALETLALENRSSTALLTIKQALGSLPCLSLSPSEAHTLKLGQTLIIRPQHGDLYTAPLIFAEHQDVPIALLEAKGGEFRVLRGFHFS